MNGTAGPGMGPLDEPYRAATARSAALMAEAAVLMPGGATRHFGFHGPYPPVFSHGTGCRLWDVDGREYIDLICNGLSLIHGHAYPPVVAALHEVLGKGWAWPGSSAPQIDFAKLILARLPWAERVRFTNSGSEAAMLAAKVARRGTGRPLVLKAVDAYHGSYDDFEAGLWGRPEVEGRSILARFNDIESFARQFERHGPRIAAVFVEPIMFTGRLVLPDPGFLQQVDAMCRNAGALFVVDDCLMFRLAVGGSAAVFGLAPDLTVLGKFIGGGVPAGVLAGKARWLDPLDPIAGSVHHGGSFNGNVLACVAGLRTLEGLTAPAIAGMEASIVELEAALRQEAGALGISLGLTRAGSMLAIDPGAIVPGPEARRSFQLACLLEGVLIGTGGITAVGCTALTAADAREAARRLGRAFARLVGQQQA